MGRARTAVPKPTKTYLKTGRDKSRYRSTESRCGGSSMVTEEWRDIAGLDGVFQVSNLGRVKRIGGPRRYEHWISRAELYRQVPERFMRPQTINSGYMSVHLLVGQKRYSKLVHRLVAEAFLPGEQGETVNHIDGDKLNNHVSNLEWASYTENHLHAVALRLNKQAVPVVDPATGVRYPSISQAAKGAKRSHRVVSATFPRA